MNPLLFSQTVASGSGMASPPKLLMIISFAFSGVPNLKRGALCFREVIRCMRGASHSKAISRPGNWPVASRLQSRALGSASVSVFVRRISHTMLTPEQQKLALETPCLTLRFLVQAERRAKKRTGMESCSESACFHRLHDIFWPLGDAETVALLTDDERAALTEFNRVFTSLPWRVIEAHPHISELPDDDLSPLIPAGERLLRLLEARASRRHRSGWLRRLPGLFRADHA